jgi:hypothetical protein
MSIIAEKKEKAGCRVRRLLLYPGCPGRHLTVLSDGNGCIVKRSPDAGFSCGAVNISHICVSPNGWRAVVDGKTAGAGPAGRNRFSQRLYPETRREDPDSGIRICWIRKGDHDSQMMHQPLKSAKLTTGPVRFRCRCASEKPMKAFLIFHNKGLAKKRQSALRISLHSSSDLGLYTRNEPGETRLARFASGLCYPDVYRSFPFGATGTMGKWAESLPNCLIGKNAVGKFRL